MEATLSDSDWSSCEDANMLAPGRSLVLQVTLMASRGSSTLQATLLVFVESSAVEATQLDSGWGLGEDAATLAQHSPPLYYY